MKRQIFLCLLLFVTLASSYAQYQIAGKILDKTNQQTLSGANVSLKNTFYGTYTDYEGNFTLNNIKQGRYTIVVSFVGYENVEKTIEVNQNINNLNFELSRKIITTDPIIIQALKGPDNVNYFPTELIDKQDIAKQNLGQDLPFLLNFSPSVVSTSDAGAGIGYTGIRIRGSDPTRINITVNGIPINDPESQTVFWVNMPDFASSVSSIQIQRGVGSSTNGAAAFGATINMQTSTLETKPYAEINNSYGSFNTLKNTLKLGTGLINNQFAFDARLSNISTDGYIQRANADLKSYFVSGGYYGKKNNILLNIFSGKEKTHQAWYGTPKDSLKTNRTYNPAGKYTDENGQIKYYNNETDNYHQTHYQLHWQQNFNTNWYSTAALHYTKGKGYFEQFKNNELFADYGLQNIIFNTDTIKTTDLIRQRWLDNDFFGIVYTLNYNTLKRTVLTIGGAANQYNGKHFGEIIWAKYASNSTINHRYYDNQSKKQDANLYAKLFYQFNPQLNAFADLQGRWVHYSFFGFNDDFLPQQQQINHLFFNPKTGLSYKINTQQQISASFSVANKEPNRQDFTESTPATRPKFETLYDTELAYFYKNQQFTFVANAYYMHYNNQLVLNGKVNDVGYYTRVNVKKSYRRGIEISLLYNITEKINIDNNFTISQNKIADFVEYIDDYDNGGQIEKKYKRTDIALSPNFIAANSINYLPFGKDVLEVSLLSKYVGKQFLDNTSNPDRQIEAYFVNDLRLTYNIANNFLKNVSVKLLINNLFATKYNSNGYSFSYVYGGQLTTENYYFPQALRNYLLGVDIKF